MSKKIIKSTRFTRSIRSTKVHEVIQKVYDLDKQTEKDSFIVYKKLRLPRKEAASLKNY